MLNPSIIKEMRGSYHISRQLIALTRHKLVCGQIEKTVFVQCAPQAGERKSRICSNQRHWSVRVHQVEETETVHKFTALI